MSVTRAHDRRGWRELLQALAQLGVEPVFFERDTQVGFAQRHLELPGGELCLYSHWPEARGRAAYHAAMAQVGIVAASSPDAAAAVDLLARERVSCRVFFDDEPQTTLSRLPHGPSLGLGPKGLASFDWVLSRAGGRALLAFERAGARRVAFSPPLALPRAPTEAAPDADLVCMLDPGPIPSGLNNLFIEAARCAPEKRFLLAGTQLPFDLNWPSNVHALRQRDPRHLLGRARATLHLAGDFHEAYGNGPLESLFTAAAARTLLMAEPWPSLEEVLRPDLEVMVVRRPEDVLQALMLDEPARQAVIQAAESRVLSDHAPLVRAQQLLTLLGVTPTRHRRAS